MGWKDACTLEKTREFQAGAAKRHTSKCGDYPGAEGRGETNHMLKCASQTSILLVARFHLCAPS